MFVLGAGLSRTGTWSLKNGLEQLGFGPCLHGYVFLGQPALIRSWIAANRSPESADWDRLLEGYNSAVDLPVAAFWREIYAHDPTIKVVLSLRDENAWYDSIRETVFMWAVPSYPFITRWGGKFLKATSGWLPPYPALGTEVMVDRVFHGKLDRESAIETYRKHNADVIATIPPEQLLVWRASDGWEPLCAFLGVPVPDHPFPRLNDRMTMTDGVPKWLLDVVRYFLRRGRENLGRLLRLSRPLNAQTSANRPALLQGRPPEQAEDDGVAVRECSIS